MNQLDGQKIAQMRQQRGWDQYELAKQAGVHPSVISRLERGVQEDARLSVVLAIADALGITVDELLSRTAVEDVVQTMVPELQVILVELQKQPAVIQQQAAGILRGFLSTL